MNEEFVKDTCKIGQGADCCRYLTAGVEGFYCGKTDRRLKASLDGSVASMSAQGDNCAGVNNSTGVQLTYEEYAALYEG